MRPVIFVILLFLTSPGFAQNPERGICVGSDKLGLDVRMANEASCKALKTIYDCKKELVKCTWQPEEMACLALNNEKEDDMKTCSTINNKGECEGKKNLCKWDYKEKGCHAKNQSSREDLNYCEAYDSNEASCNQSSKCFWGVF